MRYLFVIIFFIFASCRSEYKIIPEDELGKIIVESVVAESFLTATGKLTGYDSLSYYLPILDKYGYSAKDVDYTIERMVQRKSDVFGQLMTKISEDVVKIKDVYEYQSNMGRKFRALVQSTIFDTLYFSPDTIRVSSEGELKMLDYRVPIYGSGDIVIKYNYLITERDSNYSRYMVYSFEDSISKKKLVTNNYWLSKDNQIKAYSMEIPIRNSYRGNILNLRVMSYSPRFEKVKPNSLKSIDFYIDSVMILRRPLPDEGERRMYKVMGVPMMYDFMYDYDNEVFTIPYDTIYGKKNIINWDSVRYDKKN